MRTSRFIPRNTIVSILGFTFFFAFIHSSTEAGDLQSAEIDIYADRTVRAVRAIT